MSSTAYFICPDDDNPYGGIRVVYRFVDTLNAAGLSAAVVHRSKNFRCSWFANNTRVIGAKELTFGKGDLLVVPEWYRSTISQIAPGVPNLVLNQNTYETFTGMALNGVAGDSVVSEDTVGVVVVSEDNRKYASLCFPHLQVDRIKLSIDTDLFHEAPDGKSKTIAFMPRKRLKELNQVLQILRLRKSLSEWNLTPIHGMSEVETARALSTSAIFLALNEREGFGLPPLEAMASGCVVIGFAGGVGLEYMRPGAAIPIADGDITSFVLELESVLERWEKDESLRLMSLSATNLVKSEFSRESERSDIVSVFGEALRRVKDVEPNVSRINWRLLKPRSPRIEQFAASVLHARRNSRG